MMVKTFAADFSKGIEFFIETGFIEGKNPTAIARFLLQTDGLSKAAIGEYLGEGFVALRIGKCSV